jgi:hypothetical protein
MRNDNLQMEDAKLLFRNFAGEKKQNNPAGMRNFCVLIDEDKAKKLESLGWNIKWLKPRDDQETPQAFFQVKVSYANFPPHIVLISNGRKTLMTEDKINVLDYAEIKNADLVINPSNWEYNGRKGIAAYLKSLYVTLVPEDFEGKYSNVPDSEDFEGSIS